MLTEVSPKEIVIIDDNPPSITISDDEDDVSVQPVTSPIYLDGTPNNSRQKMKSCLSEPYSEWNLNGEDGNQTRTEPIPDENEKDEDKYSSDGHLRGESQWPSQSTQLEETQSIKGVDSPVSDGGSSSSSYRVPHQWKSSDINSEAKTNENGHKCGDFPTDPTTMGKWLRAKELKVQNQRLRTKYKKRLFWDIYAERMRPTLRKKVDSIFKQVRDRTSEESCWLYKGPPPSGTTPAVNVLVYFKHEREHHSLRINVGSVMMFLKGMLTDEQKEGIIEEWWHSSHLCGNWRCVNARHRVAEPGAVNQNRNGCFHGTVSECVHIPRCLKHLTIRTAKPKKADLCDDSMLEVSKSVECGGRGVLG